MDYKYKKVRIAGCSGAGKTYLGIVYAALLNTKTVIITTSVEWLKQWKERFLYHTNIVASEFLSISGSQMITKILNSKADKFDRYKVYTITHDTILSYAQNIS